METKNVNNNEGTERLYQVTIDGEAKGFTVEEMKDEILELTLRCNDYSKTLEKANEDLKNQRDLTDFWYKDSKKNENELNKMRERLEALKPVLESVNLYNLINMK